MYYFVHDTIRCWPAAQLFRGKYCGDPRTAAARTATRAEYLGNLLVDVCAQSGDAPGLRFATNTDILMVSRSSLLSNSAAADALRQTGNFFQDQEELRCHFRVWRSPTASN